MTDTIYRQPGWTGPPDQECHTPNSCDTCWRCLHGVDDLFPGNVCPSECVHDKCLPKQARSGKCDLGGCVSFDDEGMRWCIEVGAMPCPPSTPPADWCPKLRPVAEPTGTEKTPTAGGNDHASTPSAPRTPVATAPAPPIPKTGPDTNKCEKSTGAEVVPIGIAKAGRGIARQALDREDTSSALYSFERSIVNLLSKAQAMRRGFDGTGELNARAVARAMDIVASSMVTATGGVDLDVD